MMIEKISMKSAKLHKPTKKHSNRSVAVLLQTSPVAVGLKISIVHQLRSALLAKNARKQQPSFLLMHYSTTVGVGLFLFFVCVGKYILGPTECI